MDKLIRIAKHPLIKMLIVSMDATIVRVADKPRPRCDSNADMALKKESGDA